jgi:HAD superfamily hydrolase (TIGR01484 family)
VVSQGTIALDLDGTTSIFKNGCFYVPSIVTSYLESLHQQGWTIAFITGRSVNVAKQILTYCRFPYYLSAQNGSVTLSMPDAKVLNSYYLSKDIIPTLDKAFASINTDYVVYCGVEFGDRCFFRPQELASIALDFVTSQQRYYVDLWHPLECFSNIPAQNFPTIKCYGLKEDVLAVTQQVSKYLDLHMPVIHMPINNNLYIGQASHPKASKGNALKRLVDELNLSSLPVIAAGDDNNDESMLNIADIKIVMDSAPENLKEKASIIAPPSEQLGIIEGLTKAIKDFT